MSSFNQDIFNWVKQIPEGKVSTYGDIARLAGHPRHARQVGHALSTLNGQTDIPWHRVINAKGEISRRGTSGSDDFQRLLLEEEGVEFGLNNKLSLRKFLWQP